MTTELSKITARTFITRIRLSPLESISACSRWKVSWLYVETSGATDDITTVYIRVFISQTDFDKRSEREKHVSRTERNAANPFTAQIFFLLRCSLISPDRNPVQATF